MEGSRRKKRRLSRRGFMKAAATVTAVFAAKDAIPLPVEDNTRRVFLVPNTHGTIGGWLATFSRERIFCANNYLNHLDRVRDDPHYRFVLSEVPNIIAIMNFRPDRIPELKKRIQEQRVELVNAFFLESTVNLSGGEALVRMGAEGLRWYERVLGMRPKYAWMIDVCGTHEQMAQISAGLGLDAMVYSRGDPVGKAIFWSVSPDGSKILSLVPGSYGNAQSIFTTKTPLTAEDLEQLEILFAARDKVTPAGAPTLLLVGSGDYSLAPALKSYPSEFLKQWARTGTRRKIEFSTLSQYIDDITPEVRSGAIRIPTFAGGTAYEFASFWIENYRVKSWYRSDEQALQAAEILATIASLHGKHEYPVKDFYDSWILMCLNMDRNTLWGSAGGMVFTSDRSWDVQDRLEWVQKVADRTLDTSGKSILPAGEDIGLFNPLNWKREDPVALRLPPGTSLKGTACEALLDGSALCRIDMPGVSVGGWELEREAPKPPQTVDLPEVIETRDYFIRIDASSGALASLKLKGSGRELLAGPANVIVAERPIEKEESPADLMAPRPDRKRLGTSSDQPSRIEVMRGPVAVTVRITGTFYGGGKIRRTIRLYQESPRIDFETELNDIPDNTVVVSEFPLAMDVSDVRRGIPFGFSHGAWAVPNRDLHGWTKGIVPAVRWSDYSLVGGGGFAILDRGLSGRELDGRVPILYLINAQSRYYQFENTWLSGRGKHLLSYAVVAYDGDWKEARIPQRAWEYNLGPIVIAARQTSPAKSFLETSDNVILEAMRREGNHVEMRLVEGFGSAGMATVKLSLPHKNAMLTDLTGKRRSVLPAERVYTFPVRPQQIVTLHFETSAVLPIPEPVQAWDPLVPQGKIEALHQYEPDLKGHPPLGN